MILGVAVALVTELLSPLGWICRAPLIVFWLAAAGGAALSLSKRLKFARPAPFEFALAVMTAIIAAITGLTAVLSPPNSADAMAYHLPRVVYWAQAGSVAFFPTPYFNQVMLQPLAEYFMLHTYVLTGGDHLVNLIACGAFIGSIFGVSAIAGALGLNSRAQAMAALLCATLPNAILQASGAKNDMLLAFWLVCAVYFAARRDPAFTGMSVGLALATKATGYLFLPALLMIFVGQAVSLRRGCQPRLPVSQLCNLHRGVLPARRLDNPPQDTILPHQWAICLAAGILLINGPQFYRNLQLSGSPLGFDSARGDGRFRWRNESFGWKPTLSNAVRNTSEQLGARSPRWNQSVYAAALGIHRALGIDPDDPATTWPGARFAPPINANHEANANNRWHLLLIVCGAGLLACRRDRSWTLYAAGLLFSWLLFCAYLKWQPFLARLELPLFILAMPVAAALLQALHWVPLQLAVCYFILTGARAPALENWTRPLKGPNSLWITARNDNYFSDMGQWNNKASYLDSVRRVAASGCNTVGIDISENQLEYPFQALLRQRHPGVRFVHTGVPNAPPRQKPCAVLCLDCIANQQKIALYHDIAPPTEIGRFLLFCYTPSP